MVTLVLDKKRNEQWLNNPNQSDELRNFVRDFDSFEEAKDFMMNAKTKDNMEIETEDGVFGMVNGILTQTVKYTDDGEYNLVNGQWVKSSEQY